MAEPRIPDPLIERTLEAQVNESLATGGLYAAGLGFFAGVMLLAVGTYTGDPFFRMPYAFAFIGGVFSLVLRAVGKNHAMRGWVRYAVMLPFVSLPTLFFLGAELTLDSGAAVYITGPFSLLYMFLLAVTGFVFSPRLSIVAALLAAAEYMAVYFAFAADDLEGVHATDPFLVRDVVDPFIYGNRAMMIVATGLAVSGIAAIARRLLLRVVDEQRQKDRIDRVFGQYVSDQVKERILAGTLGERVSVVVLFSDLRGFSSFSEDREPEEVVARLNEYFDAMVAVIEEHGGVVDKFIGDAIMAVFGGVTELDDPAGASVLAARGMRRALGTLRDKWRAAGQAPFDSGIGLHLGTVVQGPIGSERRKEFTVIGDTVNTASRLEGLTKEKRVSVIVSEALLGHLSDDLRALFLPLGETIVKGKQHAVPIYGANF